MQRTIDDLPLSYARLVASVASTLRSRTLVTSVYAAFGVASATVFVVGAAALAVTLPYHDWDAFAFGTWSREIAEHARLDPAVSGSQESARPLFYALQGGVWAITGISYSAGRLLGLAFAIALLAATVALVRRVSTGPLEPALAAGFVVAIAPLAVEALEGKSDVPAAAAVATVGWLAARGRGRGSLIALGVASALAMLTKPTVVTALAGLIVYLVATPGLSRRGRDPRAVAVAAGVITGLTYDVVMALRLHEGLYAYLGGGTIGGFYAALAAQARWHAVLRADVLGPGLSLPLTFALVYSTVRLVGVRHRVSALVGLGAAFLWAFAGPFLAGVPDGPFATSEQGFVTIGFGCIALTIPFLPEREAPSNRTLALGAALGLPPLAAWVWGTAYADRLASAAWPGLTLLIASTFAAGVRALRRLGTSSALAPIPVLAVAVWLALAGFDGIHGLSWQVYRSLGWHGVWNKQRTMHLVLPAVQSALATANPVLGNSGRMITGDPRFQYFLPAGRVTTQTPYHCGEVEGYRVFVLLTADESEAVAKQRHLLATPDDWAACTQPRLRQLTDGSNGFAVFAVSS